MDGITPVMNVGNGYGDGFGFGGNGIWLFAILALLWGGNGAFGGGGYGNSNAIQADVNRGFDNQNLQAQTRDILSAVNAGTAQSVAATNQTFHDMLGVFADKYNEITRDIGAVQVGQANALANQNECCCNTLRAIDSVKMDNLANTNKILEALAQNKIEALQAKVNSLELAQAVSGVVRFPQAATYSAGMSPFCNCGCGCNG